MDEAGFDGWPDTVPWWVDAPTDAELADAVPYLDPPWRPTVAETLIEAGLAGPGPDGQRLLVSLVGRALSQDEWLTAVQLWETQEAWLAGQKGLAVAAFAGPTPVTVEGFRDDEALMTELALATGCAEGFAYTQIQAARLLTSTLVRTGDLLRAGRLSPYRARLIVDELALAHPDVAQRVEDAVLGTAAQVPTGRLRATLTQHVKRADRQSGNDRKVADLVTAAKGRRVVFDPDGEDGTGLMGLYAYLPPVEALAMRTMLNQVAGPYRKADGRSHDERVADALTGMVIGFDPDHPGVPIKPKTLIQLLIDLPTLLRLRDHDGELLGYGHLPAEVIRELTDNTAWQRLVYDPTDGHLLDAGTIIHDFPQLTEYLHLRDRYDRFPGGTRQHGNDLDHTKAFKHKNNNKTAGGGDPDEAAKAVAGKGNKGNGEAGATTPRRRRSRTSKPTDTTTPTTPVAEHVANPTPVEVEATDEAVTTVEPAIDNTPDLASRKAASATTDRIVLAAAVADAVTIHETPTTDEAASTTAVTHVVTAHDTATTDEAATGHTPPPTHPTAADAPAAADRAHARVPGDISQSASHVDLTSAADAPPTKTDPPGDDDEGGRTAANNMAALSRRHHRAKTFLGFHYRHLDNAILEWTTPLGRIYYTYPHDYRPESDTDTTGDSDPPRPATPP